MGKDVWSAQFLRCIFEVENGNISPLRVAILLQANQVEANLNLEEISIWVQILKMGFQWRFHRGTDC